MELANLAERLDDVLNGSPMCYLFADPCIEDFTKQFSGKLSVETPRGRVIVDFKDLPKGRHLTALNMIFRTTFENKRPVFTWNIKQLMSYLRFHYKDKNEPATESAIDIAYGMAFVGRSLQNRPETLIDAIKAARQFATDPAWQEVNRRVFMPLATRVLPAMETRSEYDLRFDNGFYKRYEIESHANGRLACSSPTERFLNPHTLHGEQLESLCTKGDRNVFVTFDYRCMEACVLAWLTKDERLLELVHGSDLYEGMYREVFSEPCENVEQRSKMKSIFLPLIFGMQAHGLAERLQIDIKAAIELQQRIEAAFPLAFAWVKEKEQEIGDNEVEVKDFFGRVRKFSQVSAYKRRNSEIQGPASRICLEKLVQVYEAFKEKLAFHIHDEYVFECPIDELRAFIKEAVRLLEAELDLCPGLKLQVGCAVGRRLSNLKEYPR